MSIVVGYAPSVEGKAALLTAATEAVLRGQTLTVVTTRTGEEAQGPQESGQFDADLADALEVPGATELRIDVRAFEAGADPSESLMAVAEEEDATFIVIGLRRRSKVGKLFLGSHAQRVLLDAPCPVLAVKATGHPW